MLNLMFSDQNISIQIGMSSCLHKSIFLSPFPNEQLRNFTPGLLTPLSRDAPSERGIDLLYFATQGKDLSTDEKKKLTDMNAKWVTSVGD